MKKIHIETEAELGAFWPPAYETVIFLQKMITHIATVT